MSVSSASNNPNAGAVGGVQFTAIDKNVNLNTGRITLPDGRECDVTLCINGKWVSVKDINLTPEMVAKVNSAVHDILALAEKSVTGLGGFKTATIKGDGKISYTDRNGKAQTADLTKNPFVDKTVYKQLFDNLTAAVNLRHSPSHGGPSHAVRSTGGPPPPPPPPGQVDADDEVGGVSSEDDDWDDWDDDKPHTTFHEKTPVGESWDADIDSDDAAAESTKKAASAATTSKARRPVEKDDDNASVRNELLSTRSPKKAKRPTYEKQLRDAKRKEKDSHERTETTSDIIRSIPDTMPGMEETTAASEREAIRSLSENRNEVSGAKKKSSPGLFEGVRKAFSDAYHYFDKGNAIREAKNFLTKKTNGKTAEDRVNILNGFPKPHPTSEVKELQANIRSQLDNLERNKIPRTNPERVKLLDLLEKLHVIEKGH